MASKKPAAAKPAAKPKPKPKPTKAKAAGATTKTAATKSAKATKATKSPKEAVAPKAASPAASSNGAPKQPVKLTPFLEKQRERLLILKDTLLDSMNGVARDSLRNGGDSESAFGMHQADAGSDAYDRDFALSLLSQEQDSLYEIDEALKRLETGTYGNCEMSGKPIMKARLEALPFTRYTVECQAEIEKRGRYQKHNQPVGALFGLTDDDDGDDDDSSSDNKD